MVAVVLGKDAEHEPERHGEAVVLLGVAGEGEPVPELEVVLLERVAGGEELEPVGVGQPQAGDVEQDDEGADDEAGEGEE